MINIMIEINMRRERLDKGILDKILQLRIESLQTRVKLKLNNFSEQRIMKVINIKQRKLSNGKLKYNFKNVKKVVSLIKCGIHLPHSATAVWHNK